MEFFTFPKFWSRFDLEMAVGGQHVPFENATNSSNCILISCKQLKYAIYCVFDILSYVKGHFVKWQGQMVKVRFVAHRL